MEQELSKLNKKELLNIVSKMQKKYIIKMVMEYFESSRKQQIKFSIVPINKEGGGFSEIENKEKKKKNNILKEVSNNIEISTETIKFNPSAKININNIMRNNKIYGQITDYNP